MGANIFNIYIFYGSNILDFFMHKDELRHARGTVRGAAPASTFIQVQVHFSIVHSSPRFCFERRHVHSDSDSLKNSHSNLIITHYW
jgi:hypothetical protein